MFGEFIRAKRKEKGLTQTDLAKMCYISLNTVSRYERNELNNLEMLKIILKALGYKIDVKITFCGDSHKIPPQN